MHRLTGTMLKELHFHKLLLANHTFLHISFIFTMPVRVKCRGFYFHSRPAVRALFGCWTAVGWLRCGGCPKGSYSPSESHQYRRALLALPGKHLQLTHYLVHWCMYSCKKSCQAVTRHPIRQLICARSPSRNAQQGPHACKRNLRVCACVLITTCGATCCREQ